MKDILHNLALIDTTEYCRDNNIDCSGTHLAKNGRGFRYSLVRNVDGRAVVTVTFHKNSVPTHYVPRAERSLPLATSA
jgi:hypothetical protein